jgi:hypothetical protein
MTKSMIIIRDNEDGETLDISFKFFDKFGEEGVKQKDFTLAHNFALQLLEAANKLGN